jgi:hypothetical protein
MVTNDVEIEGNQPVFVMEFNENVMVVGSGNLVVTEVGATEPTLVIPITSEMVADAVITVSYDWRTIGTLKYGTEYFVTVDGGFIEDEWENIWEGVSDETAWTFMTEDLSVAIADVQGTGSASPMIGELVEVTGTITAIAPGEGFFMQDDNAAWSGIWVAYSNVSELAIGDGVVVEGTVDEVDEVTTISATIVEVVDAPLTVVAVVVDSPSSAKAEMYESVLVQVKGARANAANTSGVWSIYYETTDIVNVNKWLYTYDALVAGNFYDVTGVVNSRMSNFRLEPRMESDIYDITVNTNIDGVSAADFKIYPNPFNDRINIDNSSKLTRVVITNIAGQRVMDVNHPEREIRTANLVSGVYVISLFTEDGMVKSDRIVKR